MPETDLNWLSATEQAALIRSRKVSPVEIVDALLARIDKVNPRLNAFVLINADQARREAKSAERAVGKRGARLGPLRSEEHTSELQSRLHLVCRLLLEKKKKSTAEQ